jgi:2-polyprenyl-3-methyl-5-hydroxy-6-metoxy-1,4-benzoquinol methylase
MPAEFDHSRVARSSSCPICSSTKIATITTVKTIHPESTEWVLYLKCRTCGHRYHNPLPTQQYLFSLYSQGSRFVVGDTFGCSADSPVLLSNVVEKLFCGQKLEGLSILEIGSGNGGFLRWLEQQGAKVAGVEPGPWRESSPNTVRDIADLPQQSFHVIILLDVLEHLSNPIEFLQNLLLFASPDTVLAGAFPNADSFLSRWNRGSWSMVRPFGHLHYFSKHSVDQTFRRAGWTILEKRSTGFRFSTAADELSRGFLAFRKLRIRKAAGFFLGALFGRDQWFVKAAPAVTITS